MERADVLIVGGGPAGSACASVLAADGCRVLVIDAARFPRDKPCAGWITPEVLAELPFSLDDYGAGRVVQPVDRFRVGGTGVRAVDVDYGEPVSWGIRRIEFDDELLRRSGVPVAAGKRVRSIVRRDGVWVVNESFAAPVIVGAGGHFCPVAQHLGGVPDDTPVVAAKEIEFRLPDAAASRCEIEEGRPELYFSRDLRGYGWCFRKRNYLNVGLGRLDGRNFPGHLERFLAFLRRMGRTGPLPGVGWRGHAYRVRKGSPRPVVGDGLVLVGDAAGLAASASGEGILPAIVSGRLAAEAILDSRIDRYPSRLDERLGPRSTSGWISDRIARALGPALLAIPGFARRVVLDRWFLHRVPGARGRSVSGDPRETPAHAPRASGKLPGQ